MPPVCGALALTIGLAFCAFTCGGGGNDLVNQVCPSSAQRVVDTPAMTPAQFCQLYMQTCSGTNSPPGSYANEADCESNYAALMFETTRDCRSYHLCNAAAYDATHAAIHCRHTVGLDLCADTADPQQ